MMKNVIYHNPRCSKSCDTLTLLNNNDIQVEVIEYLKNPPTKTQLQFICTKLNIKPLELLRKKEKLFKELNLSTEDARTDSQWIEILHKHPTLIERPIVVYENSVIIGRQPENVLKII